MTFSILLGGCGGPEPPEDSAVFADLVADTAFAEPLVAPSFIDLGDPTARRWLRGGWSTRDEQDGHGRFVWAVGESSALELSILEPRELEIELELRGFAWQGSPPQGLGVSISRSEDPEQHQDLGTFELEPGLTKVRFALPSDLQVEGQNRLVLRWAWARSPSEVLGAADRRPLAAAVYKLQLVGQSSQAAEAPRAENRRLWLPSGSRVDFFYELPAETWLVADRGSVRGSAQLLVEAIGEKAATRGEPAVPPSLGPEAKNERLQVPLPAGLHRLRLTAAGDDGGVLLEAPRLIVPADGADSDGADSDVADSDGADSDGADTTAPDSAFSPASTPKPSIVIYSIDTLRADALELWGGPVAAPEIAAFAEQSIVFENTWAQSSWTKASMASVFTGLLPTTHGAMNRRHALAAERVTLAELLSASGYQTAAFNTNPNLTKTFGFDQGFDEFVDLPESATAADVVERVEEWLRGRDRQRPLLLWVHTLDPHSPYDPPEPARQRWAADVEATTAESSLRLLDAMRAGRIERDEQLLDDLRTLYDAEAAYADQVFGDFLDVLERNSLLGGVGGDVGEHVGEDGDWSTQTTPGTAILLLSDHGEEFYEHGNLEHGRTLFQESVHVPMVLRLPQAAPAVVGRPVQHVDVMPTLLSLAGLEAPPGLRGRSLLADPPSTSRSSADAILHLHLDGAERAAIVRYPFKLMAERGVDGRLGRFQLFDLQEDPREIRDVAQAQPLRRGLLAFELRRSLANATGSAADEVELDPEMRRRLEALGYL